MKIARMKPTSQVTSQVTCEVTCEVLVGKSYLKNPSPNIKYTFII
jgi:hypothetical protein